MWAYSEPWKIGSREEREREKEKVREGENNTMRPADRKETDWTGIEKWAERLWEMSNSDYSYGRLNSMWWTTGGNWRIDESYYSGRLIWWQPPVWMGRRGRGPCYSKGSTCEHSIHHQALWAVKLVLLNIWAQLFSLCCTARWLSFKSEKK